MKRIISLVLVCTMIATMCFYMDAVPAAAASETPALVDGTYVEDELLVVFEDDVKPAETERVAEKLDAKDIEPLDTDSSPDGEETPCLVTLPKGEDVEDAIKEYEKNSKVAYAQPNYLYTCEKDADKNEEPIARAAAVTSDDTDQWNLKKIDTQESWDLIDDIEAERKKSGKDDLEKVTVAVLDTGVNLEHEDLQKNLNPKKCVKIERESTNADGTYPQLTTANGTKGDDGGHGTKVAGIIGATSGNHKGSAGVAAGNDNQIVELAVLDVYERYISGSDRLARSSDLIKGIDYAAGKHIGAKVINMSLGHYDKATGAEADPALEAKIREVVQEKNVTVVCSAGNKNNTVTWYPSDFADTISVISTINYTNVFEQCKAPTSSYGKNKDISAPGYRVMTLNKSGGYYTNSSGTSFAAPTVAAVAAMIYYVNPDTLKEVTPTPSPTEPAISSGEASNLDDPPSQPSKKEYEVEKYGITAAKVEEIMKTTATDLYTAGDDIYTRCGNVNAYASVAKASGKKVKTEPSPLTAPTLKATSAAYDKVRLAWNKPADAQGYQIYRSASKNGSYTKIKTLYNGGSTTFDDTELKTNTAYYYKIRCFGTVDDKRSYSAQSEPVAGTPLLSGVTGFKAASNSYRSIKLSWSKVTGASGYQLFRSTSKNGTYKAFKTLTSGSTTSHINKAGLAAGKTYYYKMRPYINISGKKVYGKTYSAVKSAKTKPATPSLTVSKYSAGKVKRKVKVKWSKVSEVTGYRISRSTSASKGFKRIKSPSYKATRSFIDKSVKKNKTYYYKIRAYKKVNGKLLYGGYSAVKKIKP